MNDELLDRLETERMVTAAILQTLAGLPDFVKDVPRPVLAGLWRQWERLDSVLDETAATLRGVNNGSH